LFEPLSKYRFISRSRTLRRAWASVPFAAAVVSVVSLTGPAAWATMTEKIDAPDAALTGFTGPYATVSISRVANKADIPFSSLTNGNGQTFWKSDSGVNSLATLDGLGNLSLGLNGGYPDAANLVSFLITGTTGLWTSDAAVLINNAGGYSAAIRAFACTAPCIRPVEALPAGFVGK
jgi:hypothetical protein